MSITICSRCICLNPAKRLWNKLRELGNRDIIAVKPLKLDDTPEPQFLTFKAKVYRHTVKMTLRPHGTGFIIGVPTRFMRPLAKEMWPSLIQTEDGQVGLMYLADKNGGEQT